jgi:ComF family protein
VFRLRSGHGGTALTLKAFLRRMAETGLEAILPAVCCGCGRIFKIPRPLSGHPGEAAPADRFRSLMAAHLCPACGRQFDAVGAPMCSLCGLPFASPHGMDHLCGTCRERPPCFHAARAAGLYRGPLRAAIHQHKYMGRERLADPLGRLLWAVLGCCWDIAGIDRVVPVPLHPSRMRSRGFNQAHALVRRWPKLAKAQGHTVPVDWIAHRVLVRRRATRSQTGLRRDQRAANLYDAFALEAGRRIEGQRVLLVDDVLTTGATADACARALLRGGAAGVRVLTLARAV